MQEEGFCRMWADLSDGFAPLFDDKSPVPAWMFFYRSNDYNH